MEYAMITPNMSPSAAQVKPDISDTSGRSPRHEAALAYAKAGYPVFPCIVGGKSPACLHGFKDATTDLAIINAWWAQADFNIGFEPGRKGWAVVDIDPRHGGEATWAAFTADMPITATRTVTTPSGGRHLYFLGSLPPTRAGVLGDGVDTRSQGGYVLVPPSIVGGVEYVHAGGDIVDLPERITTVIAQAHTEYAPMAAPVGLELDLPENVYRAERWLKDQPAPGEGTASDTLFAQAAWLKDYGLSREKILDMLEAHSPGYERDDIAGRIANAFKHGQNEPGARATNWGVESVTVAEVPEPEPLPADLFATGKDQRLRNPPPIEELIPGLVEKRCVALIWFGVEKP
jgi:hypothetical protein